MLKSPVLSLEIFTVTAGEDQGTKHFTLGQTYDQYYMTIQTMI